MDIKDIQKIQEEYDKVYWKHNHKDDFEKLRHITLHMTKVTGKLAAYCEKKEHGENPSLHPIEEEAMPDLLFHAAQIANLYKKDLGKAYLKRLEENKKKFS